MFTVSAYAFHPLIQRFVRLWRYVQVVSDILTCFLSILCCQCAGPRPLSSTASCGTKPSIQVIQMDKIKPTALMELQPASGEPQKTPPPLPPPLVIDFGPQREDTPEIQAKCQEFWQSAKKHSKPHPHPAIHRSPVLDHLSEISSSTLSHAPPVGHNLPAVHMARKMNNNKKGMVRAALAFSDCNRQF